MYMRLRNITRMNKDSLFFLFVVVFLIIVTILSANTDGVIGFLVHSMDPSNDSIGTFVVTNATQQQLLDCSFFNVPDDVSLDKVKRFSTRY